MDDYDANQLEAQQRRNILFREARERSYELLDRGVEVEHHGIEREADSLIVRRRERGERAAPPPKSSPQPASTDAEREQMHAELRAYVDESIEALHEAIGKVLVEYVSEKVDKSKSECLAELGELRAELLVLHGGDLRGETVVEVPRFLKARTDAAA